MPKDVSQTKYWVFTINNYDKIPNFETPETSISSTKYDYLIYQPEIGEKGTPHLQGYVCMKKKTKLTTMKKLIPTAHWEARKGTHEEAKAYCKKEESRDANFNRFYEYGNDSEIAKTKGQRTDLTGLKTLIDNGGSIIDCFDQHFGSTMRYHKGLELYLSLKNPIRHEMPEVYVFWGLTGTGKSKAAFEMTNPNETYYKMPDNKWWDGYDPRIHKDIIIDDFRGREMGEEYMLRLCDRYPMRVEVKGKTIQVSFRRIIFTSNLHPKEWSCWGQNWDWDVDHPFKRRIKQIKRF